MEWISRHSDAFNALTGAGTLLVWLVYLQVFISSYRRQLRATLVISRGPGEGISARCFLSNMSSGAVHVSSVQIQLCTDTGVVVNPITDMPKPREERAPELRDQTRQGPLKDGESRDIGSFGDLIRHASADVSLRPEAVRTITVEVVGLYGSEDLPIGARRTFSLRDYQGVLHLKGETLTTEQVRSKAQRRKLLKDLDRDR